MSQRQKRSLFSKRTNRPVLDRPSSSPGIAHFQAVAQARSAELVDGPDSSGRSSPSPQPHNHDALTRRRTQLFKRMGSDSDLVSNPKVEMVPVKRADSSEFDDYNKRHMQLMRSCSLDDLDKLGMADRKRSNKTHTGVVGYDATRRRTSTETFKPPSRFLSTPPNLQRGVSTIRRDFLKNPKKYLYKPKSVEQLTEVLQMTDFDVNSLDSEGCSPLHAIVKRKRRERVDLILALMTHSNANIDLKTKRGMTALHLAVQENCELCVKALVSFGANVNTRGTNAFTAYDLAINNGATHIEELLVSLGGTSSMELIKKKFKTKIPRLHSFAEHMHPPKKGTRLKTKDQISEYINRQGVRNLFEELSSNVNRRLSISHSIGGADDAYALVMQQRELALYNKTLPRRSIHPTGFSITGGSRILFLDGGGIKGLVELEILMQIEEQTGQAIADLFDWIVGTSTGGIIALALVYAKRSLQELRQLFFILKNRIFSKGRMGFGYNSEALEEILQEYLDIDIMMTDVTHPKVLIAAVNKATTNLELHFFNNCFGDEYCDFPVWKVARYTSAAPMFFSEVDDYVDGGVIANNPAEYGLTAIQNFYRMQGQKLPIAMVVSVGSGVYRAEKMGKVDAQEFLHFGKQWLKMGNLIKRTQNLFALLSNALVESEMVSANSRSRCEEQNIPYYRFSPQLDEIVSGGETDNEKLFNIIIRAKIETKEQGLDELVEVFRVVAEKSKHLGKDVKKKELNTQMFENQAQIDAISEESEYVTQKQESSASPDSDQTSPSNRHTVPGTGQRQESDQQPPKLVNTNAKKLVTVSSLPDLKEELETSRGFVLESSGSASVSKTLIQQYDSSPTALRKPRELQGPYSNEEARMQPNSGSQVVTKTTVHMQPRKTSDPETPHSAPHYHTVKQTQSHNDAATTAQTTPDPSTSFSSDKENAPQKTTGSLKLPAFASRGHRRAKSASLLDTEFKSKLDYVGEYSTMV